MKTKTLSVLAAFIAAFTLLLSPATTMAQNESYSDTLKVNTTGITPPISFDGLDSIQVSIELPDSASGRVRFKGLSIVNGTIYPIATDTINVKHFGPTDGASNVRFSWLTIKDSIPVQWHVFPSLFQIEVIFYNDAETYGGFTDQAVKYYTVNVRKFRHTFALSPLETSLHTLKRSTTISRLIDLDDCDSIQVVVNYPDSAQGRVRAQAVNVYAGTATAVTGDTLMLKLIDGKNIGGGTTRIAWAKLKTLAPTAGALPRYINLDVIFDATVTASGGARPVKLAEIDVRKFKHR